jgi:hypothetical protein
LDGTKIWPEAICVKRKMAASKYRIRFPTNRGSGVS